MNGTLKISSNMKTIFNQFVDKVNTNIVKPVKKHAGKAIAYGAVASTLGLGSGCSPQEVAVSHLFWENYMQKGEEKKVVVGPEAWVVPEPTGNYEKGVTIVKKSRPIFYTADKDTPESFVVKGKNIEDIDANGDCIITKNEVEGKEKYEYDIPKGGKTIQNTFCVKADKESIIYIKAVDGETGKFHSDTIYTLKGSGNMAMIIGGMNNIDETKKIQKTSYEVSVNGERRKDLDKTVTYNVELE